MDLSAHIFGCVHIFISALEHFITICCSTTWVLIHPLIQSYRCNHSFFTSVCLQVKVDCCQRLLPLIIHSILLDDSDGSWRKLLSLHIQDFFSFCSRSAQAASRSATPLSSDSGKFGTKLTLTIINVSPSAAFHVLWLCGGVYPDVHSLWKAENIFYSVVHSVTESFTATSWMHI